MRKVTVLLALSALARAGEIEWMANLEVAKRRAAAEGKLVYIDIYADW